MGRLEGVSVLEALVVLAIVTLTSAAAFGILRNSAASNDLDLQAELSSRVAQERARAAQSGAAQVRRFQDLLPNAEFCNAGETSFFSDGSVATEPICIVNNGVQMTFRVLPITGQVDPQ